MPTKTRKRKSRLQSPLQRFASQHNFALLRLAGTKETVASISRNWQLDLSATAQALMAIEKLEDQVKSEYLKIKKAHYER